MIKERRRENTEMRSDEKENKNRMTKGNEGINRINDKKRVKSENNME